MVRHLRLAVLSVAVLVIPLAALTAHAAATRTVTVSTGPELQAALDDARAGDAITLRDGVYRGTFTLRGRNGTPSAPIVISGSHNAVLDAGSMKVNYGLLLESVSYVHVDGFAITDSLIGLMTKQTNHSVISNLFLHDLGQEAIHVHIFSSDNVISHNTITRTAAPRPGYGEGVYLGTTVSQWSIYTNGKPDLSDRNQVLDNTIGPAVRGEMIDVKEGTHNGILRGNYFDGSDLTNKHSDDSWVDIKGTGYAIVENHGVHSINDGFQTRVKSPGYGAKNVFAANVSEVDGPGYGFHIDTRGAGNVVCTNNVVTKAGSGAANIALTSNCPWHAPSPSPGPSPSLSPSASPTPRPSSTPSATPTPSAGPLSYEAESNTRAGGATIASCATCSGGAKVGYLGKGATLTFNGVRATASGSTELTISFLSGAKRDLRVTVNGVVHTLSGLTSGSYDTVATATVSVVLQSGTANTIVLSNPSDNAPDIDKIAV